MVIHVIISTYKWSMRQYSIWSYYISSGATLNGLNRGAATGVLVIILMSANEQH